jgi:hypothetical protein
LAPPSIKFVTKVRWSECGYIRKCVSQRFVCLLACFLNHGQIFHPNVHFRTGDICLDILKKEWSPAWGLLSACRAVLALLSDPDASSPLNCDAGNMLRSADTLAYDTTAAMYTMENARFIAWPPPLDQDQDGWTTIQIALQQ